MVKLWRRFRDWLDPFEAEKRRLEAERIRRKRLTLAFLYGAGLNDEGRAEVYEYIRSGYPELIAWQAGVVRHQVRNGKRTAEPGVILNARDWKDLTPRRRSGPFLRLRNKRGEFVR